MDPRTRKKLKLVTTLETILAELHAYATVLEEYRTHSDKLDCDHCYRVFNRDDIFTCPWAGCCGNSKFCANCGFRCLRETRDGEPCPNSMCAWCLKHGSSLHLLNWEDGKWTCGGRDGSTGHFIHTYNEQGEKNPSNMFPVLKDQVQDFKAAWMR